MGLDLLPFGNPQTAFVDSSTMAILMKLHNSVSNKPPSFPISSLSPLLLLTYGVVVYETVPTYHFLTINLKEVALW